MRAGISALAMTLDSDLAISLAYKAGSEELRSGIGDGREAAILTVHRPGSLWGRQEVLTRFGTKNF
jgi:hypothetical protein